MVSRIPYLGVCGLKVKAESIEERKAEVLIKDTGRRSRIYRQYPQRQRESPNLVHP